MVPKETRVLLQSSITIPSKVHYITCVGEDMVMIMLNIYCIVLVFQYIQLFIYTNLPLDLPTPSECMVNTGNSSEYVSCTNKFQSGCKEILKGENYTVSLYQQS